MSRFRVFILFSLAVVVVAAVFVAIGITSLDPDFGWHLKEGQLILVSGFPRSDPFSYTMQSFDYADHEWASNVLFWQGYITIGKIGLSVLLAAIAGLSLFLVTRFKTKTGNVLKCSLLILGLGALLPFFGVRPQVFSWLFFSVLTFAIFNEKFWNKFRFVAPVFFAIWSNLHGSFALGFIILSVFILLRSVRLKKLDIINFSIVPVTLLATLINPYGTGVWREFFMTVLDPRLRWTINEWQPSLLVFNASYFFLICFYLVFAIKFHKKIKLEEKVLSGLFLLGSLSSLRNVPLFVIFSVPLILEFSDFFYAEMSKVKFSVERFKAASKVLFYISAAFFVLTAILSVRGAFYLEEKNFYPRKAEEFLRENSTKGQIFSYYGWGGYLIWKVPDKKTFIDGRMPSWRRTAAPAGESVSAMDEYLDILSGKEDFLSTSDKYHIDTVVWPVPAKPSIYKNLVSNLYKIFGIKENNFSFDTELQKEGWKIVYKDSVAEIYRKP